MLLVTRAAEDADAWVAALAARGVAAMSAPCMEYREVPFTLAPFVGRPVDLLVTSPRAALSLSRVDVSADWRVLALAPRTAAILEARGIPVSVAVEGGARALAACVGATRLPVLLGSDLAGAELLAVRPEARHVVAYRAACPAALPPAAVDAMRGDFAVAFASPSAVDHFVALAPGALERASARWCHGRTTAAAIGARGLPARMVGEWDELGRALAEAGAKESILEGTWSA